MKKLMLPLVLGLFMLFANLSVVAQFATVQIIHNSPDPLAAQVDVYVNGTLLQDDFAFRSATPFLQVPSGVNVNVGIAPSTSNTTGAGVDDTLKNFVYNLTSGQSYVVAATGVVVPANFNSTVNANIALTDAVLTPAPANASAGSVNLAVLHGATDAPNVDVLANGGATPLISNIAYGTYQGPATVPAAEYILDVTPAGANTTIVASYYVDLGPASGGSAVVFASGFLDPAMNQNGEAFGLFAALADGTVLPLTAVGNSRVQVIHNSADPGAATVDIYVNWIKDSVKLDDFAFRSATAFLDLPTGYPVSIAVAGPTSTVSSEAIATFTPTLMDGETYAVVANGVLDPSQFAANPDGEATAFGLLVETAVREAAANAADVDIKVLHGATDAPSVGVNANGGAVVPTATYGDFTGYLSVPDTEYRIDLTAANDPSNVLIPNYVDITGLAGGATLIFASGFLDPTANQNGEAFGLFAAFADGTVAQLRAVGQSRAQVIHNAADIAADTVDVYINMLADTLKLDNFAFRTATPFVDLPTGYELDIVIAGKNSTGITDNIATIPATLTDGESYTIIANGVLDPATYAVNPESRSTAFGLFVTNGAQEAAANAADVDLRVFHGATDAPTVDVLANGGTPALIDDIVYGDFQGYAAVPPALYRLGITPGADNSNVLAVFDADAAGLAGGAGVILASGFLDPTTNQDGAAFGLLLVLPDGTAVLLSNTTSIYNDLAVNNDLLQAFPNPVSDQLQIRTDLSRPTSVSVQIFDATGRVVYTQQASQVSGVREWNIDTQSLSAGIHTVILRTDDAQATKKIVVLK
ncbi:MAG: DUF4397 domain-containing protein [Bacteroidia bacterium]